MAGKQSLSIQLDADIIRKVRVLAAQRSLSVSDLVARELERLVNDEERYQTARHEALTDLANGFHLGGGALPSRDDLYER
jgi:predicted transcriptional regulator